MFKFNCYNYRNKAGVVESVTVLRAYQETASQEPLSFNREEEQLELSEIDKVLHDNLWLLSAKDIDFTVYTKLLRLTEVAAQKEQSLLSPVEQKWGARIHAIKLTIIFVNVAKALAYLNRYEKQYPNSSQLLHDACLFSLPSDDKWNITLWRGIIAKQNPSTPQDAIMKLLPHAKKIEDYVKSNRDRLIEDIRQDVKREYELRIGLDYDKKIGDPDKYRADWISQELAREKKKILKEIEIEFQKYLRAELQLPKGKLNVNQNEILRNRGSHLTAADQQKYEEIKKAIEEKHIDDNHRIEKHFINEVSSVANETKQEYVRVQLEKYSGEIDAVVKSKTENLLSPSTPLEVIRRYSRNVLYARAGKNPQAAELFDSLGISEHNFNFYLNLEPQDDPNYIPDITIDGRAINDDEKHARYYLKKLNPFDEQAAVLGILTSCCQSIGAQGQPCVIHGITDPRGGFYVLCRKGKTDTIVAQCWAWRTADDNLVFDSVESQYNFRQDNMSMIVDFYIYLAYELVTRHNVPRVLVGGGGGTPPMLGFLKPLTNSSPVEYNGYSDSRKEQRIIADRRLPIVQLYSVQTKTPEHTLPIPSVALDMDRKAIEEWCDLCCFNSVEEDERYLGIIKPFMMNAGLTDTDISNRILSNKEWTALLNHFKSDSAQYFVRVKSLIERGVNTAIAIEVASNIANHYLDCEQWQKVIWLLHKKVLDINAKSHDGITLLHHLARLGEWQEVIWLIHKGADVNASDVQYLLRAAVSSDEWDEILQLLEKVAGIKAENYDQTLLRALGDADKWKEVNWLIVERGANANDALHTAAISGKWDEVMFLLEKGADVNAKDMFKRTVLLLAARAEMWDLVRLFIDKGADINAQDDEGHNVLYWTATAKKRDELRWLVEKGAAVNAKTQTGITPLLALIHSWKHDHYISREVWDDVQWLIEKGADVNAKSNEGKTLLHDIFNNSSNDVKWERVKWLIENGADINTKNREMQTILHLLAATRVKDLRRLEKQIKWLVEKGIELDAKDYRGNTALDVTVNPTIKCRSLDFI